MTPTARPITPTVTPHTPGWTFKPYTSPPGIARIFDARSDRIGECSVDAAAIIVRAVNAHDELLEALRAVELNVDGLNTRAFKQMPETQGALDRIKQHCRAALAKATGATP